MSKKHIGGGIAIVVIAIMSSVVSADPYPRTVTDTIDHWNRNGTNWAWEPGDGARRENLRLREGRPKTYTHDLTDLVDFETEFVKEATLDLDFTNMGPDGICTPCGTITIPGWEEWVSLVFDDDIASWINLGEIDRDNEPVEGIVVGTEWINDDGKLDVRINVFNYGCKPATISLDKSTLHATVCQVPVPGAALLGLLGLTTAGVRLRRRYC